MNRSHNMGPGGMHMRGMGRGGPGAMPVGKPELAKDIKATLKRLWGYLAVQRGRLISVFILVILTAGLSLLGPYLLGVTIDKYIIPGELKGLEGLILIMLLAYATLAAFTWLQNYIMIDIAQKSVARIRTDLFKKLQQLPLKFFDSKTHGELMSRFTNDVDNISNTLTSSVVSVFSSLITIVGTLAMMLKLSVILTLVGLIIVPIMFFATKLIGGKMGKYFSQQQKNIGELNGIIEESISGHRVVKAFAREEYIKQNFDKTNLNLKRAGIRAQIYAGFVPPLLNVLNNVSFAVVAGVGGYLAYKSIITIGVIAMFVNYIKQFTRPLNELANQVNMVLSAVAGAERVFEVLNETEEPIDAKDIQMPPEVSGKVDFNHVSFSYSNDVPVLKDVDLHVKPGQMIAFVGPTGAGKTTMINLITRFYDVSCGSILIDDIDISHVKRNSLRSLLGVVLQDTYLFADTVRENIRYGRLDATDDDVEAAAGLANAQGFINLLPHGFDTMLSEDGSNLSQGQRQLINIARAILANPSVLILDEATSSVDTRTELHIQKAILNLIKGRTSFVIAHRLSTIKDADCIVVILNGEIAEKGTHSELIDKKGAYYELYKA